MQSLYRFNHSNLAPTARAGGKSGFYSEFQFILVANSIKDDRGRKESLGRCKSDRRVRGQVEMSCFSDVARI